MSVRSLQRFLVFALLGVGTALLAAEFLFGKGKIQPLEGGQNPASYTVVRVVNPVPRGSIVHAENVTAVSLPTPPVPGTVVSVAEAVGRIATQNLMRDDLLSSANTTTAGVMSGLAEIIPQGMRAIAVRVTDELAVANLIRPGDRVDVLVISNGVHGARGDEAPFPNAEVRTIVQNVRVLAVGEAMIGREPNSKDYRNVTLAVTPKEAGLVALARTVGTQYLSLRASDDTGKAPEPWALTTNDLHFGTMAMDADPAVPADHAERSVEIISGTSNQRQTVVVPQGGLP
jgi:pilus assembly protein CpaB